MSCQPWTDRLSEYLDGELDPGERAELERHLEGCTECSATLAELRRVVARARALEDRPPETDLWPGIAARIGARPAGARARRSRWRRGRRVAVSVPELLAAGIAVAVVSAAGAWLVSRSGGRPPAPPARSGDAAGFVSARPLAPPGYDLAIADLERIVTENRDRLDPATVRAIEESLQLIDRAVADAERALAEDPQSEYLGEHLAATLRMKIELLRRAATLAAGAS